jgi:RimJ/RimL family protein N-acetyltransferase
MQIIKAKPGQAQEISDLIKEVVNEVLARTGDYDDFEIGEWLKRTTAEAIEEKMQSREIFVAVEGEKIIGTIALENQRILGFYIKKELQGKGIGTEMLKFVENYAKENKFGKLDMTSTPIAVEFYKKRGYEDLGKVRVKLGEAIMTETKLEKQL